MNISSTKHDQFYRNSKLHGFRARSGYKLILLDKQLNLLKGVESVLDLCAAPGSWSQVLSQTLKKPFQAVAVDLQNIDPIENVETLIGDISTDTTCNEIISKFGSNRIDLIISDGAPFITGVDHIYDEYLQSTLIEYSLLLCCCILKPGKTFVSKIFQSQDLSVLVSSCETLFKTVFILKPASSRSQSQEAFLVCKEFLPSQSKDLKVISRVSEALNNFLKSNIISKSDYVYLNQVFKNDGNQPIDDD